MIPNNISREDILRAIKEIDNFGVPENRMQKRHALEFENKHYPPKYAISLANKFANGYELESTKFSGGPETNNFLKKRGFKIVNLDVLPDKDAPSWTSGKKKRERKPAIREHARCPRCKENVYQLLNILYSRVETAYQLKLGAGINDYKNSASYSDLRKIYDALEDYRGHKNFVGTSVLPRCDFFVPDPGFIVEYDEKQHFSRAREISLELYPRTIELGFSREKWIDLCRKIGARDNDPEYRDEQRAWYDTLRDFAPIMLGLKPTIRLYDEDRPWCDINADSPQDVAEFRWAVMQKQQFPGIEVRQSIDPFFARVIIAGPWKGEVNNAKTVLNKVCDYWPDKAKVKFLLTCGGFVQFEWPKKITRKEIGDNLYPSEQVLQEVFDAAIKQVERVLAGDLRERLAQKADYLTLGVDSAKEMISTTRTPIALLHCELVFLIGLKTGEIYITGKSYPTNSQQRGLARIADLKTHFLNVSEIGKIMVLGCHDLAIFSPRSINARRWRKKINREFRDLASKEKPSVVLHHPHTADAVMTWLPMWSCLQRELPSVKLFAGAGRYYNKEKPLRSSLDKVLRACTLGNSIDFIIVQKIILDRQAQRHD